MRCFTISFVLVLVAIAVASHGDKPHYDINEAPRLFEKFTIKYDRHYHNETDKSIHYNAFVKSLKEINEMNAKSPYATFDINAFADYTEEEWKNMFGFNPPSPSSSTSSPGHGQRGI